MAHISAQRWSEGGVDEAVANKLETAIEDLTPANMVTTIALFRAAQTAGFSEPLIAHSPALLNKLAKLLSAEPAKSDAVGDALLPFITDLRKLETNRLKFVKEMLY